MDHLHFIHFLTHQICLIWYSTHSHCFQSVLSSAWFSKGLLMFLFLVHMQTHLPLILQDISWAAQEVCGSFVSPKELSVILFTWMKFKKQSHNLIWYPLIEHLKFPSMPQVSFKKIVLYFFEGLKDKNKSLNKLHLRTPASVIFVHLRYLYTSKWIGSWYICVMISNIQYQTTVRVCNLKTP